MNGAGGHLRRWAGLALVMMMVGAPACDNKPAGQVTDKQVIISLVPRSENGPWKAVRQAAQDAASANRVELRWRSPEKAMDSVSQYRALEAVRAMKYDGLIISPVDLGDIRDTVRKTAESSTLFLVDCDQLPPFAVAGTVNTDYARMGHRAGKQMLANTEPGDVLVIFVTPEPISWRKLLQDSCYDELLQNRNRDRIELISCDDDAASISRAIEQLIARRKPVRAFFAPTRESGLAVLAWLKKNAMPGRFQLVSTGLNRELLQGVSDGYVNLLFVPDLPKMFTLAIDAVSEKLRSRTAPDAQLVEAVGIDRTTIHSPAVQSLLEAGISEEGK